MDVVQEMHELKLEATAPSFPREVIEEILFRLPVKPLIKCTSVCKTWRSIIKNLSFIRTHLSRTVNFANQSEISLLLLHSVSGTKSSTRQHKTVVHELIDEVHSVHFDNQAFDEHSKLEFPIASNEKLYNSHLRVVGTCDGLVCLADDNMRYGYNFFIWNPAIRKLQTLPTPGVTYMTHGGYDACVGFGFDAITNDYKVVRLVTLYDDDDESPTLAEVYSLTTGLWSTLGTVAPACEVDGAASQAFVNGTLHWPVQRRTDDGLYYFILTFDVGSELFGEVLMPMSFKWSSALGLRLSIAGDGKSIALFKMDSSSGDSCLDIWVMKEYCIKESWIKLLTLGRLGPERHIPRALCFRKSGEVLLLLIGREPYSIGHIDKSKCELVSLDIVSKQFTILGISGYEYHSVDSYEESLYLLDKTEAVSY